MMNANSHESRQFPSEVPVQGMSMPEWINESAAQVGARTISIPVSDQKQDVALVPIAFTVSTSTNGQTVRAHSISIRPFSIEDIPSLYSAARESIDTLRYTMTWC